MRLSLCQLSTLLPVAVLMALSVTAGAQVTPPERQPDPPITTLKLQTRVVAVSAIVRDKKGQPVAGLTRDAFTLKQDGIPQAIRYLSQGSDLPLTLGLLVDTSGSQRDYIDDETKASRAFFAAMLTRPEDRALLVQFDNNVRQLQPLTSSVPDLQAALDKLSDPHDPVYGSHGGTLLYDAVYATSRAVLRKEDGRRAMVLLTDGGDNGSRMSIAQAIGEAQRQDIVVYCIFYGDDKEKERGRINLKSISDYTGGRTFTVSQKVPLETIYSQIADDMRLQYQIGYTPPEAPVGSYHLIDLKPIDKHLVVEARKGYYTAK